MSDGEKQVAAPMRCGCDLLDSFSDREIDAGGLRLVASCNNHATMQEDSV